MAKLIMVNNEPNQPTVWRQSTSVLLAGSITGILFFLIVSIISIFTDSKYIAGNLSIILSIFIGTALMIWVRIERLPLITITSGVALWGIYEWTSGLSNSEIVLWDVLIFGITYVLFFWVSRCKRAIISLLLSIFIVIALRVLLSY